MPARPACRRCTSSSTRQIAVCRVELVDVALHDVVELVAVSLSSSG
jgi:hypothetical protein